VLAVLGQHAPEGIEPTELVAALTSVDGVTDVHDLHVWTLTSGMNVATVHLVAGVDAATDVLATSTELLRERFGIAHATIQVESLDHAHCSGADW
jgi:cobalt-zinc-cadmium efflux system protein